MEKRIDWRLFFILLGASIFGIIAVTPYLLTLQPAALEEPSLSLLVSVAIQILLSAAMFAVFIYIGLRLSKRVGLDIPILKSWLEGKKVKGHLKSILGISVAFGVLVGAVIVGIDFLFHTLAGSIAAQITILPAWQGFLTSFYGAINEEVLMRLFLMTSLVWFFCKVRGSKPTSLIMWLAIGITVVVLFGIFGIGHLPLTAPLISTAPLVVIRAIVLNGMVGVVFGWLYWKKGLESAMISHFFANIIYNLGSGFKMTL